MAQANNRKKTMRTPEEIAKSVFGFKYIDDIQPQTINLAGDEQLLEHIRSIQNEAIAEAIKAVDDTGLRYDFARNYISEIEKLKR